MSASLVIGLTGPTGAGKSSMRPVFEEAGWTYIDTDLIAREITKPASPVVMSMAKVFGEDILLEGDALDRKKLAQRAFSSKTGTAVLDLLTHPAIIERTVEIIKKCSTVAVIDAPLLFEAGMERMCDKVVAVVSDREKRRKRIMERDGITADAAERRMNAQHSEKWYEEHADIVIHNDAGFEEMLIKARELVDKLEVRR